MLGVALAGGLVFLRERMDSSIKSPGFSRRVFNAPELGVIPNFPQNGNAMLKAAGRSGAKTQALHAADDDSSTALATWQSGPAFVAESFRGTLASILRNPARPAATKR